MKTKETMITSAGVYRCCLSSVATEYLEGEVDIDYGDRSKCEHCDREFELVNDDCALWVPVDTMEVDK